MSATSIRLSPKNTVRWCRRRLAELSDRWTNFLAPEPVPADVKESLRKKALEKLDEPVGAEKESQYFELYKMMVDSSEKLVARRQGVNTFFLTLNGFLITAIGLFVKTDNRDDLQAGGIAVVALVGLVLCQAWRSLLVSFGQLNTGKFVVINAMEEKLAASIYSAEWEALGAGSDPRVYRSFTQREADVPFYFGFGYLVASILGAVIWLGWWTP